MLAVLMIFPRPAVHTIVKAAIMHCAEGRDLLEVRTLSTTSTQAAP